MTNATKEMTCRVGSTAVASSAGAEQAPEVMTWPAPGNYGYWESKAATISASAAAEEGDECYPQVLGRCRLTECLHRLSAVPATAFLSLRRRLSLVVRLRDAGRRAKKRPCAAFSLCSHLLKHSRFSQPVLLIPPS